MMYILFCLILLEILFNWLFKSNDKDLKDKELFSKVISSVIIAVSGVSLFTAAINIFFYIYFALIIASNILRMVWLWKGKSIVNLTTLYIDTLLSLAACCFVWSKVTYIIIAIAFLMVLIIFLQRILCLWVLLGTQAL